MKVLLPSDYLEYLHRDGQDSAETTGAPGYFQLWHPEEIETLNRDYRVEQYAPGFVGFGSDGGGEMLAFDVCGAVHMIPFVGMSPNEARKIAGSWSELARRIINQQDT